MGKDDVQVNIKVTGTKDLKDAGLTADELRQKLLKMHEVPVEQRDAGWVGRMKALRGELRATREEANEAERDSARRAARGGGTGSEDPLGDLLGSKKFFQAERGLAGLMSGHGGIRGLTNLAGGLGLAEIGTVGLPAMMLAHQTLPQIMPEIKKTMEELGTGFRTALAGLTGNNIQPMDTRGHEARIQSRIEDLEKIGPGGGLLGGGRTATDDAELKRLKAELEGVKEHTRTFNQFLLTQTESQQAQGAAVKRVLGEQGPDFVKQLRRYREEELKKSLLSGGPAKELADLVAQEEEAWKKQGSLPGALKTQLDFNKDKLQKMKVKAVDDAVEQVGQIYQDAVAGIPGASKRLTDEINKATGNLGLIGEIQDEEANAARRTIRAQRKRAEDADREELLEGAERGIRQRARRAGVKLSQKDVEEGAAAAVGAFQEAPWMGKAQAGALGFGTIDKKWQEAGQNIEKFNAEMAARTAMMQMLPDFADLAANNAGVAITPDMFRNAVQDATAAIKRGAAIPYAIYGAMNKQVMEMQQFAFQMNGLANQFNQLMPAGGMWGGMW